MAAYFFDSSALVKRYVVEPGASYVNHLLGDQQASRFIVQLSVAEVVAAVVRRVDSDLVSPVLLRFTEDVDCHLLAVNLENQLVDEAVLLIRRYRLRGCDSLQLAAALRIFRTGDYPDLIFVSADDELNAAATAEGLTVENPNRHP
jgi:uncharacterized protein